MPHGKTALTLMMALALPGAAQALGLGEIHLNSALNEPLAADIEIVGATAEDLAGITASIANREAFEHLDVDRPAFLSTVVFKLSRDSRGRAVLAIRSTDACTEPLLNMLVDLRWRGGELVRQYTLLLDPPGFPSATPAAAAVVDAPASDTAPVGVRPGVPKALIEISKPTPEVAPAASDASTTAGAPAVHKTVKIGAKATLRGVAWRVGSRSDADLKRMMIAIFHANPNAFEGNINRLRRGKVLTIPSAIEVSAISVADANREVRAQMQAWRAMSPAARVAKSAAPAVAPAVAAPVAAPRDSPVPGPPAAGNADSAAIAPADAARAPRTAAESATPAEAALAVRLQQLESRLEELQNQFDREHDALGSAQAQLTVAEDAPAAAAAAPDSGRGVGSRIAALLVPVAAAFGIYAWRRRRAIEPQLSSAEPEMQDLAPAAAAAQVAVGEAAAPGTVRVEPRAVRLELPDVPHETARAPSATPLHAEAGERQGTGDALARRPDSVASGPNEAVNPNDAIDVEALEASYLLHGGGGGFEDNDNFGDTAILPVTVKLHVDDPSAETMPVETVKIAGILGSTTHRAENALPAAKAGADATKLDYNLLDLDATVHHVQMPSALHETPGFKERRTSLVDVLKSAVEREPQRSDLRMKLLETYFAAAATNRQGFLEVVQKIAHERASLKAGEWDKIAWMGRQIASDDHLFAPVAARADEEDLENCA
jgi:pilus assembly protein FimV